MNGSQKIQASHLSRQAVIYIRQSDPKQVREHRESGHNQRALRDRVLELGWRGHRIDLVEDDQGRTAKHTAGRDAFQKLAADVGLRKVGIIVGYEVSRLARNCADWYQLLELCAFFDTLLADADGVYNARDFNDRLLLGLKGTLSEAELHSLHLRLDAGRLSKARRAELVQHLPTGLLRDADGVPRFDPDRSVQDRIRLVFDTFRELGSAQKVLRFMGTHGLKLPRRQASGLDAGRVLRKEPNSAMLISLLKNPAYAGAYAYGQRIADPARRIPGRPATGRIRQPPDRWLVLVKDVYPAYITWGEHERIRATIEENRQKMAGRLTRKQAIRSGAALLTGLVRCGRCGHAMQVAYKNERFQYICRSASAHYSGTSCQYLSGAAIDEVVVQEFFRALQPAEINALEGVNSKHVTHRRELEAHLEQEVRRLEYAAGRAERQYDSVDPENRLIAATLERKWEEALAELDQSRARLAELKAQGPPSVAIPLELRAAFADAGRRLPELWDRLAVEARKTLLRTLVTGVNLNREGSGVVRIRIAWRGGLVGERSIGVPVHTLHDTDRERDVLTRIRDRVDTGQDDAAIAEALNREGFRPCRGAAFTAPIVLRLRLRHQIWRGVARLRRGERPPGYTVGEMARRIGIDPSWISRKISRGQIVLEKDPRYGCYLFPRTRSAIAQMKRLKSGQVLQVAFPKEHCDG
jgi:DNA invertase Pin-like site-specific DNA recombinase